MMELREAAALLKAADDILILSHQYPDGDTLGAAAALCRALQKLGKRARCDCADEICPKYRYLFEGVEPQQFQPKMVVAVDVADKKLLGPLEEVYEGKIDLCIDHHGAHAPYAKNTYVDSTAAATCEIIRDVVDLLGVSMDPWIASCIYTGISTDTGCFRYTNATPKTYRVAADMMEVGVDAAEINRVMFDTKSRARLEMERSVLESIEFFFEDRCAVAEISLEMVRRSKALESDLEGLAAIPRQVEGVLVGITLREKEDGGYKVSVRTQPPMNAASICREFGGGGHPGAAGCNIELPREEAKKALVQVAGYYLNSL